MEKKNKLNVDAKGILTPSIENNADCVATARALLEGRIARLSDEKANMMHAFCRQLVNEENVRMSYGISLKDAQKLADTFPSEIYVAKPSDTTSTATSNGEFVPKIRPEILNAPPRTHERCW